jgi:GNAT superfamily N-acetyltransferase
MPNIRLATLDDVPDLIQLGAQMHAETAYQRFHFDPAKVKDLLTTLISVSRGIVVVAEEDFEIHGGLMAAVAEQWFGPDLVATDYALFLSPEYRGGSTAKQLIQEYVRQAKAKGASQVLLGVTTGLDETKVQRLFNMLGGTKLGAVYEL